MDTKSFIADAKARFTHNSAKDYLKEKFTAKMLIADQGGLWKADLNIINFLTSSESDEVILMDTFENPIKVNRVALLDKLKITHEQTMQEWHSEWSQLEKKR